MSENDKDYVYNLLTNNYRYVTKLSSAIYMVGATNTNNIPTDLTTSDFCHNYYSTISHNDRSYDDTDIVHPKQTSPYVSFTGVNIVFDSDPNRDASVDNFL